MTFVNGLSSVIVAKNEISQHLRTTLVKKPVPFGKYYLLERIAVGGMAEVFKARQFGAESFEKTIALKRILPNIAEDEEFITMFTDEAKIAVQLTHANIAQILDLGQDQGTFFIAMEFVPGKDLRTLFERARRTAQKTLEPQQVAFIIGEMCKGLHYAHQKKDNKTERPLGIIHRDVSPQNVLVSYEGGVKVIDFGVAKAQNKIGKTQAGILKGKFGYMSPEQVQGLPMDHRSDIFSAGIVLHELLTGKRLFIGESDFHTLEKIRKAEAEPPSKSNPNVPSQLDAIVMKALARDVNERYQTANQLAEDLQRFLFMYNPVYKQEHLTEYMAQTFQEDLSKEKHRNSQYDQYFAANPQLMQSPQATNNWMPNYTGSFNSPAAFGPSITPTGATPHPQTADYSSLAAPNPLGHHNSVAAAVPQYAYQQTSTPPPLAPAMPPAPPPVPGFGGGGYGMEDVGDSTMMDPGGAGYLVKSIAGPPSPGSGSHPKSFLIGDQMPSTESALAIDNYSAMGKNLGGEETDTIIDMPIVEDEEKPRSKALLLTIVASLGIGLAVVLGALFYFKKGDGGKKPVPKKLEPGKISLRFTKGHKGVRFILNGKPVTAKNIKVVSSKTIVILIFKKGRYTLEIRKPKHRKIKRALFIAPGGGIRTPIYMRPLRGRLRLKSNIQGASISLNGKIQKKKTPTFINVLIGKYTLRVLKQGYTPWEQKINVRYRKLLIFDNVKLKKTKAKLFVRCRRQGTARLALLRQRRSSWRNWRTGRIRKGSTWNKQGLDPTKSYRLKIMPKGYKEQVFNISFPLDPVKTLVVDCSPPPKNQNNIPAGMGLLKVRSAQAANVFVNGEFVGKTPLQKTFKPAKYKIELKNIKTNKIKPFDNYAIRSGNKHLIFVPKW